VKLIAVDVDDTLLTSELEIPGASRQAFVQAQAAGIDVVLATGRMYRSVLPYARSLGITGPLITYNGALIKDTDGVLRSHSPVHLDLALEVAGFAVENSLVLNAYLDDELYVAEMNEQVEYYEEISGVSAQPVGDLATYLQERHAAPTKLLIVGDAEELKRCYPFVERRFGTRLQVAGSKPRFIEFTQKGVSKGRALAKLAAGMGLTAAEIMAIGDGENDMDMIEYAGIGVAVANAPAAVRAVADYVVASGEEAGVAEAIQRFALRTVRG